MYGYFWSNTIWYVALLVLTLAMLAAVLKKADDKQFVIAFAAAVFGLLLLFEYIVGALFDAYQYLPKIVLDDDFQDSVFGNIFSQTSIAVSCVLFIVLRLKSIWYFVFAVSYFFIELLFEHLGIFIHHWYRTIYTPLILVPLFWVIRHWYYRSISSRRLESRNLLVFLGTMALFFNTVILTFKLLRIHIFSGEFFQDMSRDHTTTLVLYGLFFIGIVFAVYKAHLSIFRRTFLLLCIYLLQYGAYRAGLMKFSSGWFPYATILEIVVCWAWLSIFDKLVNCRYVNDNCGECDSYHKKPDGDASEP